MEWCTRLGKSVQFLLFGVAIFISLFYKRMAVVADECGTKFTDVASSAVLAQVVLQGAIMEFNPVPAHSRARSANVTINRIYKGMDIIKGMGKIPTTDDLVIHHFGAEDKDRCIASDSDSNKGKARMYFLRESSQRNVLQLSALPVDADGNIEKRVRRSLCDTCVRRPVIKRMVCRRCAREPTIKPIKSRKVKMGRRGRLRCAVKGVPPSEISWTKGNRPVISGEGGITIRKTATTSTLVINKAMAAHSGEYKCVAVNSIGRAEALGTLDVSPVTSTSGSRKKNKIQNASDKVPCDNNLCLNGGTCFYSASLDLSYCQCRPNFEGVRCENFQDVGIHRVETTTAVPTSQSTNQPIRRLSTSNPVRPPQRPSFNSSIPRRGQTGTDSNGSPRRNLSGSSRRNLSGSPQRNLSGSPQRNLNGSPQRNLSHVTKSKKYKKPIPGTNDSQYGTRTSTTLKRKRPKPQKHSRANRTNLNIVGCREKDYCLNGGVCKFISKLNTKFCQCRAGFVGHRCERLNHSRNN